MNSKSNKLCWLRLIVSIKYTVHITSYNLNKSCFDHFWSSPSLLSIWRSSGIDHGSLPSFPMTPLRAMAAIIRTVDLDMIPSYSNQYDWQWSRTSKVHLKEAPGHWKMSVWNLWPWCFLLFISGVLFRWFFLIAEAYVKLWNHGKNGCVCGRLQFLHIRSVGPSFEASGASGHHTHDWQHPYPI